MIVGGYALDLYCDKCDRNTRTGQMQPDVFVGEYGSRCRSEARKIGWTLRLRTWGLPDSRPRSKDLRPRSGQELRLLIS